MKFLRSDAGNEWSVFLWRDTEKKDVQPVSPEVADQMLNELDSRAERKAQKAFESALKKLQSKLDRNKVDTGELPEIATVLGATVATPEEKNMAERALRLIPVEDVLKWGARGSHAETLKHIFVTGWRVDLRGMSISEEKEEELCQLLGQKTPKEIRADQKRERIASRVETPADKFENWIESGMMTAEIIAQPEWTSVLASTFRAQSPETLRMLFASDGTVNFHGNKNASRYIGAGNLFGPEQEWIEINGKLGRRSIDPKFNSDQIGYVDVQGNYLKIMGRGTESIRAVGEPSAEIKKDFVETLIVGGEESYRGRFDKFLAQRELSAARRSGQLRQKIMTSGFPSPGEIDSKEEFAAYTVLIAKQIEATSGIPWQVTASQASLETGFGRDGLSREYNNFFGKKATGTDSRVSVSTSEDFGDGCKEMGQDFATYDSPEESFIDYAKLLQKTRYRGILEAYQSGGAYTIPEGFRKNSDKNPSPGEVEKGAESITNWTWKIDSPESFLRAVIASGYATLNTKLYVERAMGTMATLEQYDIDVLPIQSENLTFAEARQILVPDRFKLWSSGGGFTDRTNKTHTTLDGLKKKTALGAVSLLDELALSGVTITGGTEDGHGGGLRGGPGTHGFGNGLDWEDYPETNRAFETYFARNGVKPSQKRLGELYEFESNGFQYKVLKEDDHWDLKIT